MPYPIGRYTQLSAEHRFEEGAHQRLRGFHAGEIWEHIGVRLLCVANPAWHDDVRIGVVGFAADAEEPPSNSSAPSTRHASRATFVSTTQVNPFPHLPPARRPVSPMSRCSIALPAWCSVTPIPSLLPGSPASAGKRSRRTACAMGPPVLQPCTARPDQAWICSARPGIQCVQDLAVALKADQDGLGRRDAA